MKYLWIALLTVGLTILTQVGGLIYLAGILILRYRGHFRGRRRPQRWLLRGAVVAGVYLVFVVFVVPPVAEAYGRVPLPVTGGGAVRPLTLLTPLCNRHYVDPRLYRIVEDVATRHPAMTITYLDANFPFLKGFPLLPHLSHDDGRKLDLAFQYRTADDLLPAPGRSPAPLGYGAFESPGPGEYDQTGRCLRNGFAQYDYTKYLAPAWAQSHLVFDAAASRELVMAFADQPGIGKLFLEPHLRKRVGITNDKVRFQGCRAVRHDDHLHVQL